MPIPPQPIQSILNTAITQTVGGGREYPTVSNKVQNPATPVPNPPAIVGVDVVSFKMPAAGVAYVTSPNIPARSSASIPPNAQAVPVQGTSTIITTVGVQVGRADCVPFATDIQGIMHSGSIQQNNTFRAFGAKCIGTPGENVTIALTVYYQR